MLSRFKEPALAVKPADSFEAEQIDEELGSKREVEPGNMLIYQNGDPAAVRGAAIRLRAYGIEVLASVDLPARDDQQVLDNLRRDLWDRASEKQDEVRQNAEHRISRVTQTKRLPDAFAAAEALFRLAAQVMNGGYFQWVENDYAGLAPMLGYHLSKMEKMVAQSPERTEAVEEFLSGVQDAVNAGADHESSVKGELPRNKKDGLDADEQATLRERRIDHARKQLSPYSSEFFGNYETFQRVATRYVAGLVEEWAAKQDELDSRDEALAMRSATIVDAMEM